jgi:hypothetical protein
MGKPHNHLVMGVQYGNLTNDGFPYQYFETDSLNKWIDPLFIQDERTLLSVIGGSAQSAMRDNREVRITNLADKMCFWIKGGKVVWNGKGDLPEDEKDYVIPECTCDGHRDDLLISGAEVAQEVKDANANDHYSKSLEQLYELIDDGMQAIKDSIEDTVSTMEVFKSKLEDEKHVKQITIMQSTLMGFLPVINDTGEKSFVSKIVDMLDDNGKEVFDDDDS